MAHVLIVEDSTSVAASHAYSLWEFGHTVTFAYSAKEARECFQKTHHDVVLLDFDLPDGTGLEVFRSLQQVDPAVCVVMVTGKGDECLAAQILKEGAKDYLTKSSELQSILPEVVDRVLHEREIQLQLEIKEQQIQKAHMALEEKINELAATNQQLKDEIEKRISTAKALEEAKIKLESALEELGRTKHDMHPPEKMVSKERPTAENPNIIDPPIGFVSSNLSLLNGYVEEMMQIVNTYKNFYNRIKEPEYGDGIPDSILQLGQTTDDLGGRSDMEFLLGNAKSIIKESIDRVERIKHNKRID